MKVGVRHQGSSGACTRAVGINNSAGNRPSRLFAIYVRERIYRVDLGRDLVGDYAKIIQWLFAPAKAARARFRLIRGDKSTTTVRVICRSRFNTSDIRMQLGLSNGIKTITSKYCVQSVYRLPFHKVAP